MASSNAGGYEHEFLEPSAKLKEFECPLCLHVTREPHLTDCCGQHFCQACINRIITNRKPCPLCKTNSFNMMIDKKQKRRILELKVKCTMKERGCDWSGELGKLDTHVDTRNGSCLFVDVNCPNNCGKSHQRRYLTNHLSHLCPKRPFTCKYCQFKATYEQVCNDHYPKCVKYPVPCPNKCEIGTVEQGNLEQHMSECPLQVVECHLGCSERIKRTCLPKHIRVCPKRLFTCKYCGFIATYEQVCNIHYLTCVKYPVPCPNNCKIRAVKGGNLEQHLSECPLQVVECEFSHAGCSNIKRKNVSKHMERNVQRHLDLVSRKLVDTEKKLSETEMKLVGMETRLSETMKLVSMETRLSETMKLVGMETRLSESEMKLVGTEKKLSETEMKLVATEKKLAQTKMALSTCMLTENNNQVKVLQSRVHPLQVVTSLPPTEFTVLNYSRCSKRVKGPVISTAPKIQFRIFFAWSFNQIWVELWQLPCESDGTVNWPMKCTATATLLNQSSDQHHISGIQDYVLSRPTKESCKGPDVLQVDHSTIKDHSLPHRQYSKHDNLKFRFLLHCN